MIGRRVVVLSGLVALLLFAIGGVYFLRDEADSELYDQQSKAKHFINEGRFEEGLEIYRELSLKGMEFATYSVAQIYSEGWGVQRDRLRAEDYLKVFVGQAKHLCEGVPKIASAYQLMARDNRDPEERKFWRKKALDAGYQDSKCPPSYSFLE